MTSTVEFMGGPAHGTLLTLCDDVPPPRFAVLLPPASCRHLRLPAGQPVDVDPVDPDVFRYRREVSDLDDGPPWVYVPDRA